MKITLAALTVFALSKSTMAASIRGLKKGKKDNKPKKNKAPKGKKCPKTYSELKGAKSPFPLDNSERLLHREGVIDEIPPSLCGNEGGKNVMLVVGDGMGWEMIRAGAVAKLVIDELEGMGCDTKTGCPDMKETAMAAFADRTLDDYYTEGKGHGLSFQDHLDDYTLVTTSAMVIDGQNDGAHYAPARSLLEGSVSSHDNGMSPLSLDDCTGEPIDFDPRDYESEGGNMVLWDDVKGGEFPWDSRYFTPNPDTSTGFDPEFIMRHATDSASTAGALATGHKAAVNMMAVNLYEEDLSTIVEDAMMCGKAAGVISSVPVLHATPGSFVTHSNYRKNGPQMQRGFEKINPTYAAGGCASRYQPSEAHKESMEEGGLSNMWTFIHQDPSIAAENFYDPLEGLDPNNGDHVMVCFGGSYTESGQSNAPYRGLDSTYTNRYCSSGVVETDAEGVPIGVTATTSDELCNHYSPEEVAQLPTMAEHVKAAVDFLGKSEDGFFLMYEQGDIDWAAHGDHMDDMLGAMLDINDGVQYMIDWIMENGGWEKNALYVTADHDHFLTLLPQFPEAVAKMLIMGESHKITPQNNTNQNPWSVAIAAGRHDDDSKSVTEHIADFTSWTEEDIETVGHFWGTFGSGGNGWGSHSSRPVPMSFAGDDGCVEALKGKGYNVLGKPVEGSDGKIDQVHVHACMLKNLFGL